MEVDERIAGLPVDLLLGVEDRQDEEDGEAEGAESVRTTAQGVVRRCSLEDAKDDGGGSVDVGDHS